MRRSLVALIVLVLGILGSGAPGTAASAVVFTDITAPAGIAFVHKIGRAHV